MKTSTALLALFSLLPVSQTAHGAAPTLKSQSPWDSFRLGDPEGESSYHAPFFANAELSLEVTDPEELLGQLVGSRMATDLEIRACFEAWAKESERVILLEHGVSHEGRAQYHVVVTSPANHACLLYTSPSPRDLSTSRMPSSA